VEHQKKEEVSFMAYNFKATANAAYMKKKVSGES
jgi:hypothetical protein